MKKTLLAYLHEKLKSFFVQNKNNLNYHQKKVKSAIFECPVRFKKVQKKGAHFDTRIAVEK